MIASFVVLAVVLLRQATALVGNGRSLPLSTLRRSPAVAARAAGASEAEPTRYATYWEDLLLEEYEEAAGVERHRRAMWSRRRLEAKGFSIFSASATPESELWDEKVVRVRRSAAAVSDASLGDHWRRGDTATLTVEADEGNGGGQHRPSPLHPQRLFTAPRECVVVDAARDWLTVGVGSSWPAGLWEARRSPGTFLVRLDRITPNKGPLNAQRAALRAVQRGVAGEAAALLASSMMASLGNGASPLPPLPPSPAAVAPSFSAAGSTAAEGILKAAKERAEKAGSTAAEAILKAAKERADKSGSAAAEKVMKAAKERADKAESAAESILKAAKERAEIAGSAAVEKVMKAAKERADKSGSAAAAQKVMKAAKERAEKAGSTAAESILKAAKERADKTGSAAAEAILMAAKERADKTGSAAAEKVMKAAKERADKAEPAACLTAEARSAAVPRRFLSGGACAVSWACPGGGDMAAKAAPSATPDHGLELDSSVSAAISAAISAVLRDSPASFAANPSQQAAVAWALGRTASLIRGPPGTGKTRVASLLIAAALQVREVEKPRGGGGVSLLGPRPRVLAVAHSNGAADVLLEALVKLGVPAIRAGRPASCSPQARPRTAAAVAERHPEVVALRLKAANASLPLAARSEAALKLRDVVAEVKDAVLRAAPVVVASCIGAHRLSGDAPSDGNNGDANGRTEESDEHGGDFSALGASSFPLVVLDEAAQTTEPALVVALAKARAEQVVMVGDTKQLPPTVPSEDPRLRAALGLSPMARLERTDRRHPRAGSGPASSGGRGAPLCELRTLALQYRMPRALLEHPSRYFYDGAVKCAPKRRSSGSSMTGHGSDKHGNEEHEEPPPGFPWPAGLPLAFVHVGGALVGGGYEVEGGDGGKSNPTEALLVAAIVAAVAAAGGLEGFENHPHSGAQPGAGGQGSQEKGEAETCDAVCLTPYALQVDRIASALQARGLLDAVKVSTVDAFQGREAGLVVFSAVRSNAAGSLGFLRDPRRLCVALTRARRGLVVVGDAGTLVNCRHWKALIDSCEARGCLMDAAGLPLQQPDGAELRFEETREGISSRSAF